MTIPFPSMEQCIFPIIVLDRSNATFTCLGTGFFFHTDGWFVSAKHVIDDYIEKPEIEIIGIQSTKNDERHVRFVTDFNVHPVADIMVGKLGEAHDISRQKILTVQPAVARFSFAKLHQGDQLVSYGYPNTASSIAGTKTQFNFKSQRYTGQVKEWLEIAPFLPYPCYQTTINFKSGSSGGPVFTENAAVVGIHTASFDLDEGEPISYITPIDMMLELGIFNEKGETVSVRSVLQRTH